MPAHAQDPVVAKGKRVASAADAPKHDPALAAMLEAMGKRIRAAADDEHGSVAEMVRKADRLRLPDYNQVSRWTRGEAEPSLSAVVEIARVCRVSLDWLVLGHDPVPLASYFEWLETSEGRAASPEARLWLRTLPLRGYQPSRLFWTCAYRDWLAGRVAGRTPEDAAKMARDSEADPGDAL